MRKAHSLRFSEREWAALMVMATKEGLSRNQYLINLTGKEADSLGLPLAEDDVSGRLKPLPGAAPSAPPKVRSLLGRLIHTSLQGYWKD